MTTQYTSRTTGRIGTTLTLALVLLASAAQAADEPRRIVSAPVQVASTDGLLRLSLPLQALQASRRVGWGDIWLVDSRGDPLPQAWAGLPPSPPAQVRWSALPLFAWPEDLPVDQGAGLKLQIDAAGAVVRIDRPAAAATAPGGTTAWLLDLHGLDTPPRKLRLAWPATPRGLRRQATVEASDDAQHWRPAGSATLIEAPAATAQSASFLRREIELDTGTGPTPRYLRLQVDQPLVLAGVEAQRVEQAPPADLQTLKLPMQPATGEGLPAEVRNASAAWLLDLGGPVPVERIQVQVGQANQVLPLRFSWKAVEPPAIRGRRLDGRVEATWLPAGAHTAYTLHSQGRTQVSPPFDVRADGARWWLAVAQGSVPAGTPAPELSLGWRPPQLVFAARGTPPYRLQIGGERPSNNRLDLATLIPGYTEGREHDLPQAAIGSFDTQVLAEPDLLERVRGAGPEERKRWLLWGVLALAVLVLGAMAWKLAGEVKAKKDGEGS